MNKQVKAIGQAILVVVCVAVVVYLKTNHVILTWANTSIITVMISLVFFVIASSASSNHQTLAKGEVFGNFGLIFLAIAMIMGCLGFVMAIGHFVTTHRF